ncbi:hypothetical protein BTE77_25610 [Ensifer adhaerens]|nr:hypothetical protein BTE77_25610 [Ensifer adhaerens]
MKLDHAGTLTERSEQSQREISCPPKQESIMMPTEPIPRPPQPDFPPDMPPDVPQPPIEEPEPDIRPDEVPNPNPDENDTPPKLNA